MSLFFLSEGHSTWAGGTELNRLVVLLGKPLWMETYEGYSLAERVLGRAPYGAEDIEEIARRLGHARPREPGLASEVESRLDPPLLPAGSKGRDGVTKYPVL